MAAFRVLNQAPQYLLADGSVNAGGKLYFYETDLTTPKNTWSDEALSVLNSNPVVMDAAGRTLTDVWGSGEYGVVMKDAAGVTIWTRNNTQSGSDPGLAIPALESGKFLTNNASVLLWEDILQVPDPTGHADQALYSDGSLAYWGAVPSAPDVPADGVDSDTSSIRVGTTLDQWGSSSFPATGSQQSNIAVVFATPFNAAPPNVTVQMGPGATMFVMCVVNSISATGFTATIDTNLIGGNIVAPQPFMYRAVGPVTL